MLAVVITLLIVAVLALVLVLGVNYIISENQKEPDVKRKWTDPKFHD